MHLLSINIGAARTIGNANVSGQTGIYKLPVAGPVQVTADGLADDAIVDTRNHGGPDQAVYVYGGADYAWWRPSWTGTRRRHPFWAGQRYRAVNWL